MNEMDTRFANQYNIQWFPGHMTKTLRMMEQEIQHVDASLVLLDARIPLSSLNPEIERITAGKPHLYVLNKSDLADPEITRQWLAYFKSAGAGCIAMDSKQRGRATATKGLIEKELSALMERRRNRGRTAQDLQRKAELVVVVHFVRGLQRLLVAAVQVGQILNVGFQFVQFRVGQAHIFNVGDGRAQILDRALGGVLVVCVLP